MNIIKKHKFLVLFISIFIVLMIIVIFGVIQSNSSSDSNSKYGNRLVGIENMQITDSRLQTVKGNVLSDKSVNDLSHDITGRIIKIFIQVKPETDEIKIQSLMNIILENFTDDEKKFYDFQVFITNEVEETELYPMIAYKHRNNVAFTITKKVGEKNEK
ncbi:MAG: hypothetical protein E7173_00530 [Firmicutes bacterium]|nr:hypothetical protein [Bacillota bacterium]